MDQKTEATEKQVEVELAGAIEKPGVIEKPAEIEKPDYGIDAPAVMRNLFSGWRGMRDRRVRVAA
jgi:hypothetical protein